MSLAPSLLYVCLAALTLSPGATRLPTQTIAQYTHLALPSVNGQRSQPHTTQPPKTAHLTHSRPAYALATATRVRRFLPQCRTGLHKPEACTSRICFSTVVCKRTTRPCPPTQHNTCHTADTCQTPHTLKQQTTRQAMVERQQCYHSLVAAAHWSSRDTY